MSYWLDGCFVLSFLLHTANMTCRPLQVDEAHQENRQDAPFRVGRVLRIVALRYERDNVLVCRNGARKPSSPAQDAVDNEEE